jgi:hypothetical protein
MLDSEYVNLLQAKGKNTRFDEKTINLVSEILSKYRILLENSEEVDIKSHLFNLKKEMNNNYGMSNLNQSFGGYSSKQNESMRG